MSKTTEYTSELDTWLPDEKAIAEVRRIVEIDGHGSIDYDSGSHIVPLGTDYEVVSKALIKQPQDIGFGSCFRVTMAIGGLVRDQSGIAKSPHGFATVWFSIEGALITIDFAENTPI